MASAMGGFMHITGTPDEPVKAGVAITDICTGLYLHGAILAALYSRTQTNVGQKIDVSLLQTQVAVLANIGQNYHMDPSMTGRRWGTQHEVKNKKNNYSNMFNWFAIFLRVYVVHLVHLVHAVDFVCLLVDCSVSIISYT
jgi:crotonobetainyl-CoA:carnitine CoA-transferase CaiB-like acyl-CoA transferase